MMVIVLSVLVVILFIEYFFVDYGRKSMYRKTVRKWEKTKAELDTVKQENDVMWEGMNGQIAQLQTENERLKKDLEDCQDRLLCYEASAEGGNTVPWDKVKKGLIADGLYNPKPEKNNDSY